MSEFRLTDGNLIVVYALASPNSTDNNVIPDFIKERVKVALETFRTIVRSKPDKDRTMVIVAADPAIGKLAINELVNGGVKNEIIALDSDSANTPEIIDRVYELVKTKPNPPFIYFVGPFWIQDAFKSATLSRMKNLRIQFYGAMDRRPFEVVEREKANDAPKKGTEFYKQKIKNKAVDVLLNVIFPD